MKDLHIPFDNKGREAYLEDKCHLDCSDLIEKPNEWIKKIIIDDPGTVLGEMSNQDLASVKQKIKLAKSITVKQKKRFNLF